MANLFRFLNSMQAGLSRFARRMDNLFLLVNHPGSRSLNTQQNESTAMARSGLHRRRNVTADNMRRVVHSLARLARNHRNRPRSLDSHSSELYYGSRRSWSRAASRGVHSDIAIRTEPGREPERPTTRVLKSESLAAARLRLSFIGSDPDAPIGRGSGRCLSCSIVRSPACRPLVTSSRSRMLQHLASTVCRPSSIGWFLLRFDE